MSLKKVRGFSAIGVWASIAYLVIALYYLVAGEPHTHARYMLYGVLLLFPYSVSVAYVASALNRYHPWQIPIAAGVLLLAPAPLVALSVGEEWANLLVVIAGFLGFASALYTASMKRGSVRLSLELAAAASLLASVVAIVRQCFASGLLFSYYSLAMTLAYPVTLIHAVTVHALPSTFKDRPQGSASWLLPLLTLLGALLVLDRRVLLGALAGISSVYVYVYAARLYRLGEYFRVASGFPEGPARGGAYYFLEGHVAVLILVVIMTVYLAWPGCNVICRLHLYALGFSSLHVLIHGPMMLPVILGIRHRRRFNPSPYVLQLLAVLLFPFTGDGALVMYVLAILASFAIVL